MTDRPTTTRADLARRLPHRPSRRPARRRITAVACVVAVLGLGACSSEATPTPPSDRGDGTATSGTPGSTLPPSHATATSAPAPGAPVVLDLSAPSTMSCAGTSTAQVPVAYRTSNATEVAVLVDGTQAPGLGPANGEQLVPVPCDGRTHVLVVTAIGADGATGTDSIVVTTEAFGAP